MIIPVSWTWSWTSWDSCTGLLLQIPICRLEQKSRSDTQEGYIKDNGLLNDIRRKQMIKNEEKFDF